MLSRILLLAIFALTFSSASAYAGLDQLCLKQCVNAGTPNDACLKQCSYDQEESAPVVPKVPAALLDSKTASPHNVVDTPMPVGTDQIVPPPPAKPVVTPPKPEKDYVCFNACLQTKKPYALCEQNCAKPTDAVTTAVNGAPHASGKKDAPSTMQLPPAYTPRVPYSPYPPPPTNSPLGAQ